MLTEADCLERKHAQEKYYVLQQYDPSCFQNWQKKAIFVRTKCVHAQGKPSENECSSSSPVAWHLLLSIGHHGIFLF